MNKETQLHIRKTDLLILGGRHLFSIDKIRKDSIVQRYCIFLNNAVPDYHMI